MNPEYRNSIRNHPSTYLSQEQIDEVFSEMGKRLVGDEEMFESMNVDMDEWDMPHPDDDIVQDRFNPEDLYREDAAEWANRQLDEAKAGIRCRRHFAIVCNTCGVGIECPNQD